MGFSVWGLQADPMSTWPRVSCYCPVARIVACLGQAGLLTLQVGRKREVIGSRGTQKVENHYYKVSFISKAILLLQPGVLLWI